MHTNLLSLSQSHRLNDVGAVSARPGVARVPELRLHHLGQQLGALDRLAHHRGSEEEALSRPQQEFNHNNHNHHHNNTNKIS